MLWNTTVETYIAPKWVGSLTGTMMVSPGCLLTAEGVNDSNDFFLAIAERDH